MDPDGLAVALQDVDVVYGDRKVLDDVNMNIPLQTGVTIVGPSGSGKSTLLRVIAGVERPTRGHVRYGGFDPGEAIAPIPQLPVFSMCRSALDNLAFVGASQLVSQRQGRADAARELEQVGLSHVGENACGDLSGGELQRLAIARALLRRPVVLVADEPTANLDTANAFRVCAILASVRDRGSTVIVATHDVRVVELFDRVVSLRDGHVVEQT